MSEAKSFGAAIASWGKGARQSVTNVRRFILVNMGSSIIADTPVLTGMLKCNWQTSINVPKTSEIPLRPANLAVAEVVDVAGKLKGDEMFVMRNNRPYAVAIEYGHSKKRPEGMVRQNIVKWRQIVKKEVMEGRL